MNRILYLVLFFVLGQSLLANVQAQCISGCNDNAFVWSHDPNTLEYDNMISTFHSSILKEIDGTVKVWGEGSAAAGGHLLAPTVVNSANGFNYQGKILKIAAGSEVNNSNVQFIILTTEGLYAWGKAGIVLSNSNSVKSTDGFGKVGTGTGLPAGIQPADVKMMFGTYKTLAIVTCTGQAWVLSQIGKKSGNDSDSPTEWVRVRKSSAQNDYLTGVVAMRGSSQALMALTDRGEIYTWGTGTYLGIESGTGSNVTNRGYATKMTLPDGVEGTSTNGPKMIGMANSGRVRSGSLTNNNNSYYLLTKSGDLYSLGNNSKRQLGDYSTSERKGWVRVKGKDSNTNIPAIVWFSPNEHDAYGAAAVNAVTKEDWKLWSWGSNDGQMIGRGSNAEGKNPAVMNGMNNSGLAEGDRITAVETGGHTTMVIRECSKKYGYVGHKTNGSMGDDGKHTGGDNVSKFDFQYTADVNLCGAPTAPGAEDLIEICENTTANLNDALLTQTPPNGYEIVWRSGTASNSPVVNDPTAVAFGTYYAFFEPVGRAACSNAPSTAVTVDLKTEGCCLVPPGQVILKGDKLTN